MKIYLAPMEGITGYVFRNAYMACYGGIDTCFTPFLSNPVLNQIELHDVLPEHNRDLHVIPQILTNRPETFAAIAGTLKDYGYSEVNLNLGCPSGTVVAKKRGAGALREPRELDRLLDGIYSTSPLPVSVKCRIGISSEAEWEDILEVLLKYPMTELIIHPRFQKEFYKGNVHMEAFALAYERIRGTKCALCYNGDITTPEDYRRLVQMYPDISAVMLGRGLLWNPELAEQIRQEEALSDGASKDTSPTDPPKPDIQRLKAFLDLLYHGYKEEMDREGPALMKLKELWSYLQVYTGLPSKELRPLWKSKTLAEYRDVVNLLLGKM